MVYKKVRKVTKSYENVQKNINFLDDFEKKYTFAADFCSILIVWL